MTYSEKEGWQQLGPDWRGGSGTYTNSSSPSWIGKIAYPGYPTMLDGSIIYAIREYSGSSDNPVWDGTAMYSQGPDLPFRTYCTANQMTPKCNSGMHESMADQGTFIKDEYKKLYFVGYGDEQHTTTWNKNSGGCDGWESTGGLWLGNISRILTIENKIFCAEERRSVSNRYKIEYWVQQYDLRGKDYTRMDEYRFNQNPNYRPDKNLEIAVGFNSLIARDRTDSSIWMFRPTEKVWY